MLRFYIPKKIPGEVSTTSAQILFHKCHSLLKGMWFSLGKWLILGQEQRRNKVILEYTHAQDYYFCLVYNSKVISNRNQDSAQKPLEIHQENIGGSLKWCPLTKCGTVLDLK